MKPSSLHARNSAALQATPPDKPGSTHRLLSSSFLGLPYRILNTSPKKELLRSLWVALPASPSQASRDGAEVAVTARRQRHKQSRPGPCGWGWLRCQQLGLGGLPRKQKDLPISFRVYICFKLNYRATSTIILASVRGSYYGPYRLLESMASALCS